MMLTNHWSWKWRNLTDQRPGQVCQLISQNYLKTIGIICIFKNDPLCFLARAIFWSKFISESMISGRKPYENHAVLNARCSKLMKNASCICENIVFLISVFRKPSLNVMFFFEIMLSPMPFDRNLALVRKRRRTFLKIHTIPWIFKHF